MNDQYEVAKVEGSDMRLNRAMLDERDILIQNNVGHIELTHQFVGQVKTFIFSIGRTKNLGSGKIGINKPGREWASLITANKIKVKPYRFDPATQYLSSVIVAASFSTPNKNATNKAPQSFDTRHMAAEFSKQFTDLALSLGQRICFYYPHPDNNFREVCFTLHVKELQALQYEANSGDATAIKTNLGLTTANTVILFESDEGENINFVGDLTTGSAPQQILNPNWDFESMGIGGLSDEFSTIFRRAFASRMLPASIATKIGVTHVRGMLLYGPPGTGKTLIARQIGKLLSAREPKVVNGPEILNKFVGESERNIRELFAEAEEEQKKMGANSGLHMIIFDEIDAICKSRSATAGGGGAANDTVVNQLLTKIDGVNALNNVLVIGMTNRRDLIDEALMRPGRLEVQMEIGLPNESGRLEIFKIHTRQMVETKTMSDDVNLEELAALSKNFSGAEIKGLVTAAQSLAINRVVKANDKLTVDLEKLNSIEITRKDFLDAIEKDIKPALGASEDKLQIFSKQPLLVWDPKVEYILDETRQYELETLEYDPNMGKKLNILLVGEPGCGKTSLAAHIALRTKSPFIRVYEPADTKGFSETSKVQYLIKLFSDAHRSQQSCLVIDGIEAIIDYKRTHMTERFSNQVLQSLQASLSELPPKGRSLLNICTCKSMQFVEEFELKEFFQLVLEVPVLTDAEQVQNVFTRMMHIFYQDYTLKCFDVGQQNHIYEALTKMSFRIGIKYLLDLISIGSDKGRTQRVEEFLTRFHRYESHPESARKY